MSAKNEVKMFYVNDIVYRFDRQKKIVFGIVLDSYESSDSDTDSNSLKKGQIRVYWLNNSTEQVCKQKNVTLKSRSVIPGDIVRRLEEGKETQRGYCQRAKQTAVVQIVGTDKVIENVSHDRLANVTEYEYGAPVCIDKHFGRIQNFDERVTLFSKCGSIVEILQSLNLESVEDFWLTKNNHNLMEECNYFYPGQEVTAIPSSLEVPVWIKKSKIMKRSAHNRQRFTVQKSDICNVEIAWQTTSDGETFCSCDVIDAEVPKVKVLENVEAKYIDIAERKLLKLSTSDVMVKKRNWVLSQSHLSQMDLNKVSYPVSRNIKRSPNKLKRFIKPEIEEKKQDTEDDGWSTEGEFINSDNESTSSNVSVKLPKRKHYPPKPKELVAGYTVPVEILCTTSTATVVWQDGTEEKDIPTTQLYFSVSLDDHEFFPGEWVVRNDKFDKLKKFGVIQSVDYLERTAKILWFTKAEENYYPPIVDCTIEMSVYDVIKHHKFIFRPGTVVYKLPVQSERLGTIIDSHPDGLISVKWLNYEVEKCWPTQLEILPDSIDSDDEDDEDVSVQVSWETESIETVPGDITNDLTLQSMAARLDFIRSRIVYLKEAFQQHNITENITYLRDLLVVYENSSYLDKLLETSFFNSKSKHYQALLQQVRERGKICGMELRTRCYSVDGQPHKVKTAERDNLSKVLKLEHKINAQIENAKDKESGEPSTPLTPDIDLPLVPQQTLCIEMLSMLKARMDLTYAEIISRIGGAQALSVMTKASRSSPTPTFPSFPTTPEDSFTSLTSLTPPKFPMPKVEFSNESYTILDEVNPTHRFYNSKMEPRDTQNFLKVVHKEGKLMQESLPEGVWVRSYANRLDLLSVMICGADKTPYEDGLFIFDIQLTSDYPRSPPVVSYISFSSERLNPNLYVEGRVCISLLGTWLGEGSEVWGTNSTLLQLIVSIQGLILVTEPYYNEAGYEKQCDSQQGCENSRTYNESVILKLVQSMTEMLKSPPIVFKEEIYCHFNKNGAKMFERLKNLINDPDPQKPEFPLLPVSKGFKLSLNNALNKFQEKLSYVIKQNALG